MNTRLWIGFIASSPAAAFLLSWPRQRAAAWAVSSVALLACLAGFSWVSPSERLAWALAGLWGAAGAFYASYVAGRNMSEYDRLESMLQERKDRVEALTLRLRQAKFEGARKEEEHKEVTALYGMVKGLSESLSWEEVRPKLEMAVRQYLGADEFALYVADLRRPDVLHPLLVQRLGSSVGASWEALSRLLQERGLSAKEPHQLESPERAVSSPILDSGGIVGYFYVRVPPNADARSFMGKVVGFAGDVAFAFSRLKLFQELERLSQIDGLTGVYRRGLFDSRLKEEVARARTFKTTFCLMLLDVDHFKRLNDTYGHPFGDQVLRRVGEILRANVYEIDFIARYGGEEFGLLLSRAEPAGVLRKAEAIRAAVEREEFSLVTERVRVTVSIGVAHFPRDGDDAESVVRQADRALFRAKAEGRDRVVDAADLGA